MTGCPSCGHDEREHSREDGVGCLQRWFVLDPDIDSETCPCTEPGTSAADQ